MTDRDSLHALLDHHAIERLHAAYADAVNRRAWSDVDPLFEPDAPVVIDTVSREPFELVGASGLTSFLDEALGRFAFFEFVALTLHVEPPSQDEPDVARSRLWMCEVRRDVGSLDWSTAYGLYRDTYRRGDGAWRFAERRYRSITRTGGDVFPLRAADEDRGPD